MTSPLRRSDPLSQSCNPSTRTGEASGSHTISPRAFSSKIGSTVEWCAEGCLVSSPSFESLYEAARICEDRPCSCRTLTKDEDHRPRFLANVQTPRILRTPRRLSSRTCYTPLKPVSPPETRIQPKNIEAGIQNAISTHRQVAPCSNPIRSSSQRSSSSSASRPGEEGGCKQRETRSGLARRIDDLQSLLEKHLRRGQFLYRHVFGFSPCYG